MVTKYSRFPQLRWPPVYIGCILSLFKSHVTVSDMLTLFSDLADLVQNYQSGKEWEKIVELAILLQCLSAQVNGGRGPFDIVTFGTCTVLKMHQLKPETQTFDAAYAEIIELYTGKNGIIKPNSITLVTTTYAKFPDFVGFIVYCRPLVTSVSQQRAVLIFTIFNTIRGEDILNILCLSGLRRLICYVGWYLVLLLNVISGFV